MKGRIEGRIPSVTEQKQWESTEEGSNEEKVLVSK